MKTRSASSRSGARDTAKRRATDKRNAKTISAEKFDALADSGADLTPYVDWSKAHRPGREVQRVNVDFPLDLLKAIDQEARRIGVTRQAFIKLRLSDALTHS
jgi:hypothetical protein